VVAVLGEQFTLPVGHGLGVEPFDAAHDQPSADVVGLAWVLGGYPQPLDNSAICHDSS